ncbi:hypothetical protein ECC02_012779 [Trypanosoma cruzi]|uniref:Mucin TcMUCII n=1 Tax=Trypanosoma cruzi TaxID=5693 RepID=A0A7J6XL76_TRYCR|nr:hypothetical protein ECC02_012779 [Trypanosoma cruzi]
MQTPSTLQKETRINGCFIPFLALDFACAAAAAVVAALPVDQQSTWCAGISPFSMVTLLLCCCGRCTYSRVCVRTLREGSRHDGPLSPYVHAVEPCVPLLFASPSSICVLVLRQGCVCVCACCRGLECVSCVVCGVRCMPGCCPLLMWCALCVCLPHLSSPLLLSMSLTVQISSTPPNDHTHDDDVPSAVRPVGACPVLLPVRVCDSVTEGSPSLSPAQSQGAGGLGAKNTSATSISTVPADALPSKSPGTGTVEIPGNGAEQPDGTSGLQGAGDAANRNGQEPSTAASTSDSADPTEKVQEPGTISGTGGTEPLKQSSTGQAQSGNPTLPGSSAGTGVRGSPDTPSPGPNTKQEQAPGGSDGSGSSGGSVNPNTSSSSVTGTVSAQSQKEHAPTTTTTTTTKAPTTTTTTTTEAPTTTTTRAPSRLREIDGSLSSSAWVCAPLLLAVSALAYTTLG